jgi:MFS family permease
MLTLRVPERTPDRPCVDCLDQSPAARQTRLAVPRRVAFWLVALILSITMLGTTLPTPLYVIYQGQWHFSAAIVTVTFAVYAAAVLATLLLAGRSSDQAGRKPVLAAALASSALTVLVFEVYLAVLAAAGLCLLLMPETVSPRRRPALRFAGLGIPERGRSEGPARTARAGHLHLLRAVLLRPSLLFCGAEFGRAEGGRSSSSSSRRFGLG